jgi:hypothetical protein
MFHHISLMLWAFCFLYYVIMPWGYLVEGEEGGYIKKLRFCKILIPRMYLFQDSKARRMFEESEAIRKEFQVFLLIFFFVTDGEAK